MNRTERILLQVRDSLADPNEERWSTSRLLRLMDEGQKDIARQTKLLRSVVTIPLVEGQAEYELPEDAWLITRTIFNKDSIPLVSHADLDNSNYSWFCEYGKDIKAVVYDQRNLNKLRMYPIPNDEIAGSDYAFENDGYVTSVSTLSQPEGVTVGDQLNQLQGLLVSYPEGSIQSNFGVAKKLIQGNLNVEFDDPNFGVVTSIDGDSTDTPFGVVVDAEEYQTFRDCPANYEFNSSFGSITRMRDLFSEVSIYYVKEADEIKSTSDNLIISSVFDTALKYYVIAKAYDDDLDTAYQNKSDKAMLIYQRELDTLGRRTSTTNGTKASQYVTNYRSAF